MAAAHPTELAEIREDEARGDVAATYGEIRETLGVPVVNYIWRHIATIEGGLSWCWPRIREAAPSIHGMVPSVRKLADRLLERHDVVLERPVPLPLGAMDVLDSYNRGNAWNFLSMALLAAARAGAAPNWPGTRDAPGPERRLHVPPYPRAEDLSPPALASVATLSLAGPASGSGVRPSLWVHLGLWPDTLTGVERGVAPLLASGAFAAAWSDMQVESGRPLGLAPRPPRTVGSAAPLDEAIRRFRSRIAEMVLVGRAMRRAQPRAAHARH